MPYLEDKLKELLNTYKVAGDGGQINYLITMVIINYLTTQGLKYIKVNDVVGALECCKLEFYRRIAAPYEDKKIIQNGDVYPSQLLEKLK